MRFRRQQLGSIITMLLIWGCCEVSSAAVIHIHERAVVSGTIVTLGDVAKVTQANSETVERLYQVELAPAPPAGRVSYLNFSTIRSRLLAQGMNLADVEFTGKSRVKIETSNKPVQNRLLPVSGSSSASQWQVRQANHLVTQAIQSHLRRVVPQGGKFLIKPQIADADMTPLLRSNKRSIIAQGGKAPWSGRQQFQISFSTLQQAVRSIVVNVEIQPLPFVLAAQAPLARGHLIREADLIWSQTDDRSTGFDDPKQLIGKEILRPLHADEVFSKDHVQKSQLVRSNDIVSVYVRSAAFSIHRQFKARESGALGDRIKLVSLTGKDAVVAQITGFREAEIVTPNSAVSRIPRSVPHRVGKKPSQPQSRQPIRNASLSR